MRSSSRRMLLALSDDDESGAGELYAPADALQKRGAGFFFSRVASAGRRRRGEAELLQQR